MFSLQNAQDIIDEINGRFKEHGIGYEFQIDGRKITRIDSELIHSSAVKPALRLLNQRYLAGAQDEFLSAHEHFQKRKYKEALNDALKSFESTMKCICEKHSWSYSKNDGAKKLIDTCLKQNLIPEFWQEQFTSLSNLLSSGVPSGRNRISGHGQGPDIKNAPEHLVSYVLHMTASAIVFLAEAEKGLKRI